MISLIRAPKAFCHAFRFSSHAFRSAEFLVLLVSGMGFWFSSSFGGLGMMVGELSDGVIVPCSLYGVCKFLRFSVQQVRSSI